jgi:Uma2 family endonuclease
VITMTATAPAGLPFSRALTRADLKDTPDDGHRYELIDGALLVTPSPMHRHQSAVGELYLLLRLNCPADLQVLLAPFDVVLAEDTVVQPDLLVARRADFTEHDLPVAPLLAVEILSPSTRRIDLMLKRSRYEAAGCPSYWVVDPDVPSIIAWELRDGVYELVGDVSGDEPLSLEQPYPVTVVPARLFD